MRDRKQKTPRGKCMNTVKVGGKGQIVIPKDVRDMFDIRPGDTLLVLADIQRGIGIVKNDVLQKFARAVLHVPQAAEDGEEQEG